MKVLAKILLTAVKYLIYASLALIGLFLLLYLGFPYISRLLYEFGEKEKAVELGRMLTETGGTIVAVGAHPDDIEWWAGGTLAKAKKSGARIVLIIATDSDKNGQIRRMEQMKAAEIIGYDKVYFLGYPDGKLSEFSENEVKTKILEIFETEKPKTVLTFDIEKPAKIYRHRDHLAAGKAALSAAKSYGVKRIYLFHTSSPNAAVNITPLISQKLKAYASHKSQQGGFISYAFNVLSRNEDITPATHQLRRMSKMFGSVYGFNYAEIFRFEDWGN
jgi:LmbE family N-acetylglucosaminyl deacetylase